MHRYFSKHNPSYLITNSRYDFPNGKTYIRSVVQTLRESYACRPIWCPPTPCYPITSIAPLELEKLAERRNFNTEVYTTDFHMDFKVVYFLSLNQNYWSLVYTNTSSTFSLTIVSSPRSLHRNYAIFKWLLSRLQGHFLAFITRIWTDEYVVFQSTW